MQLNQRILSNSSFLQSSSAMETYHHHKSYHRSRNPSNSDTNVPLELTFSVQGKNCKIERGRFLGKGSFACCFEFVERSTRQSFAVKTITKEIVDYKKQYEKVVQEVAIHFGLNHPNIVKLYQAFETDQGLYLAMEYVPGGTLLDLTLKPSTLSEKDKVIIFRQLVESLNYLHSKSIVHRDVKLENILLCQYGNVKLGDFGFARTMTSRLQRSSSFCGTKPYLSPEIIKQEKYDPFSSDWYSAGIVFYTVLSGRWPFKIDNISESLPLPRVVYPRETFSPEAIRLLQCMINSDVYLRADYNVCMSSPLMQKYGQGQGSMLVVRNASNSLFKFVK